MAGFRIRRPTRASVGTWLSLVERSLGCEGAVQICPARPSFKAFTFSRATSLLPAALLFWEDVLEPYGSGPRFPIAVVQDIFNVFPFHFLKKRTPRLRECLKERSSVRLTKDHGTAIVGVSDSSLIRRFCARFSGFHSITVFEIEAGAFFDVGE